MRLMLALFVIALTTLLQGCGGGDSDSATKIKVKQFTITSISSEGGSISPQSINIDENKTATFTLVPDENYIVSRVIGCSGTLDGDTYTTGVAIKSCSVEATFIKTSTITGVAQLGLISGATVKLFKLPEMSLIAKTQSSSSPENYGAFSFSDITLEDNDFYLLESTGGIDTDPNDDGIVVEEEMIEVQGKVRAIVTGLQLTQNTIRVTALSDIIYQQLGLDIQDEFYADQLNTLAKALSGDFNNDSLVDYDDILAFEPLIHKSTLNVNYDDIVDIYIPSIYSGKSKAAQLKSLLTITKPAIVMTTDNYKIVPFDFSASLENLPSDTLIKWTIDDKEHSFPTPFSVNKGGVLNIVAEVYYGAEKVTSYSQTLYAAETEAIASSTYTQNTELVVDLTSSFGIGASVTIPAEASTENLNIEVKKVITGGVPADGEVISNTLVLYPAGATFQKPVSIVIPYYGDNEDIASIKVARFSSNGDKDYLTPTFIDTEAKQVHFETLHFTSFAVVKWCVSSESSNTSCARLKRNFSKIKALMANHYNGDVVYSNWDEDTWEEILNTSVTGKSGGSNVYDYFLDLNSVSTLVQVLDNANYTDANNPSGIGQNMKYLTAYNYLYKNDATIQAALKRWTDIKVGLEAVSALTSATKGVSIATDGARQIATNSLQLLTSSLDMFNPPQSSSAALSAISSIDFTGGGIAYAGTHVNPASLTTTLLSWIDVPIYNPIKIGDMLVNSVHHIAFNAQIESYILGRKAINYTGHAKLEDLGLTDSSTNWWFQTPTVHLVSKQDATKFFRNVENMYQNYKTYKDKHADSYNYKNACGDVNTPCEGFVGRLTPEANFIALFMTAYKKIELEQQKEYIDDNPSFTLGSFQINQGELLESQDLEINTQVNQPLALTLHFNIAANEDYIDNFSPKLEITKVGCSYWSGDCDELQGLIYSYTTTNNSINGDSSITINITPPSDLSEFDYRISVVNKVGDNTEWNSHLSINVKQEYLSLAPKVKVEPLNEQLIEGGDYVKFKATVTDDGKINKFYWAVWLGGDWIDTIFPSLSQVSFSLPRMKVKQQLKVKLTVIDDEGKSTESSSELTVRPENANAPVARANWLETMTFEERDEVTLNALADDNKYTSGDAEDGIEELMFNWRQTQGIDVTLINADTAKPTFIAPNVNSTVQLYFELTVTDTGEKTGTDTVMINVVSIDEQGPTANAGEDQIVTADLPVNLNGNQSVNGEGNTALLTYIWEQTDTTGYNVELSDNHDVTPTFDAPLVTTKQQLSFSLTVTDNDENSSTDSVVISIEPKATKTTSLYLDLSPKNVISDTDSVYFTITGENLPTTLAVALEGSDTCSEVTVAEDGASASITCGIPSTEEKQLIFYIKNKPEVDGGAIISGAEGLTISVTQAKSTETPSVDGFDFPIGNRGVSSNQSISFAEQLSNELNSAYKDRKDISNNHDRSPTTSDTTKWRNAQDVGSFLGSYGLHSGEDWNLGGGSDDAGQAVYAVAKGKVVNIKHAFTTGLNKGAWAIVIQHKLANNSFIYSLYAHTTNNASTGGAITANQSDFEVKVGDIVNRGQQISRLASGVEMTSIVSSHLHFEMRNIAPPTTGTLWPNANGLGYYSHDKSKPVSMTVAQINTAFNTMQQTEGLLDPSDYIDYHRAGMESTVTELTPTTGVGVGQVTTFTITGVYIPSTVAMSLAGSESCGSVYDISPTSVKIDCTPNTEGEQSFYIKNKSGGVFLRGSENLTVSVQAAQVTNIVLGINFIDENFATCVQEHVNTQQVTALADLTSLDCSNRDIINVSELSYMMGLVILDLHDNQIVDINLDENLALGTVNLLNTNLNQQSLDYLASITEIANLNYQGNQLPPDGELKISDIEFVDPVLKSCAVEHYGEEASIAEVIELFCHRLSSMDDIKKLTNLSSLVVHEYNGDVVNIISESLTALDIMALGTTLSADVDLLNLPNLQSLSIESIAMEESKPFKLNLTNNQFLTSLHVGGLNIAEIDLSNNLALFHLSLTRVGLTSIDITKQVSLASLNVDYNKLSTLDVSNNTALVNLDVRDNQLTSLDVSELTQLSSLDIAKNSLDSINLSNNLDLVYLNVSVNKITLLDVTALSVLKSFYTYSNFLKTVNLSNNPALNTLYLDGNQLTSINLSNNPALNTLYLDGNQLTSINLSNSPALEMLSLASNQLTSIDLSNNQVLEMLSLASNQLTSIDLTNNTALFHLMITSNQLTSIDLSHNIELMDAMLDGNPLTSIYVGSNTGLGDLNHFLEPNFGGGVFIQDASNGFLLSWNAATGAVSGYDLYRSTQSDSLGSIVYSGSNTSYTDSNLSTGITYYYTVKACNDYSCDTGTQDYKLFE